MDLVSLLYRGREGERERRLYIPTKVADVRLDPLEGHSLILNAEEPCSPVGTVDHLRKIEESKHS